jgi:cell division protein FtsW
VFPAGGLLLLLVLAGGDLGTGLVLLAIIAGMLFVAGVPARMFLIAGASAAALAASMALTSANRMGRIHTWLVGCTDPTVCFQTIHGQYALADGGWWGVGLGASREKWSWLPAAHNDFIFAIIGEELGLPGTLVIIGLFGLLAFACYRLVLRSDDFFTRVATAGVMVWILAQAVINIGGVIGLLPVIGVPLPLVSSGGSALMATLFALGMLLSFARNERGCRAALAARPGVVRRSLAVMATRRGRRP